MKTDVLYYGDNLGILRKHIPDESVDLVYLDPPFNSNRAYNVIFKDESGRRSDAQIEAFDDTWHWGPGTEATYTYLTLTQRHQGRVPDSVSAIIAALRRGIGTNQMMAYLVEMTVRLVELHRVLKSTGSLYLHCDPTASHYLKVVLDSIFGPERFVSEIIWQRTNARGTTGRWPRLHDVILQFAKGPRPYFEALKVVADQARMPHTLITGPDGEKYQTYELTAPGASAGESGKPWRGFEPARYGRHWGNSLQTMDEWDRQGLIHWAARGGFPRRRAATPFDASDRTVTVGDIWTDVDRVNQTAKERLGYPTQKPLALLERIITASTRPGDVVLDPFCGCGTALIAAQTLGRRWIGIDVTHLAIAVMRARLRDAFPKLGHVEVIGQPTEVEGARMLAQESLDGRYEFQYWALSLVDAQPVGGRKKGADSGIDGRITFTSGPKGEVSEVLVSVKSGNVNVSQVRDLKGTMEREGAPLGLFLTLEEPSKPMLEEAATSGVYRTSGVFDDEARARDYPRVQILTIRELLEGKRPQLPLLVMPTYQQAERVQASPGQLEAFG